MQLLQTQQTVTTLGNAADLTYNVVNGVLGNDVADTFNGSPLTRQVIYNLALARIQLRLAPFLKVNQHA
jgi:hypothetical protein